MAFADFNVYSGTVEAAQNVGVGIRAFAKIWDVGSDWYRCQLSCIVSSENSLRSGLFLMDDSGNVNFTGNGSDGIEIAHAQMRQFPFMGQYVETTDAAIVGTGWQTGSKLILDGFDGGEIIKAGTRFEVVNQFNNQSKGVFNRSEFKRATEEIIVHQEGWAILPFDPPIRNAPETDRNSGEQGNLGETMHNPVVFDNPETTCRLVGSTIQYIEKPLKLTDIVFDIIEDLTT